MALLALGIGPRDEVITVPGAYKATAEAVSYCGAKPVFIDVDEETYPVEPSKLGGALVPRTKAIIPVYNFGQMEDMDPILEFARKHGLFAIEDAVQAHGAEYKGRKAGTLGDVGAFSFYPGRNLGAFGEGEGVTTNRGVLQEKIRVLRGHGQVRKYHHTMIGWNCRMDGIQAGVLSIKLRHLEKRNQLRRPHPAHYDLALRGMEGVLTPHRIEYGKHVYHIYLIRVEDRDDLLRCLTEKGIGWGIHYPIPGHFQEAYRGLGYTEGSFPVAERCASEFVSLPTFPKMTPELVGAVAEAVKVSVSAASVA